MLERIISILRGLDAVSKASPIVLAGLFLNIIFLSVELCVKYIIIIFRISPESKGYHMLTYISRLIEQSVSHDIRSRSQNVPTSSRASA